MENFIILFLLCLIWQSDDTCLCVVYRLTFMKFVKTFKMSLRKQQGSTCLNKVLSVYPIFIIIWNKNNHFSLETSLLQSNIIINISSQLRHNCDVKPKLITWPWYNVRCLDKRHALDIKKKKRICLLMIWLWNTIALEPYTWTLKLIDILSMCCFIIFLMMHKAIRLMHVDLVLDWIKIMFWA